jgi:hypothetical protein
MKVPAKPSSAPTTRQIGARRGGRMDDSYSWMISVQATTLCGLNDISYAAIRDSARPLNT